MNAQQLADLVDFNLTAAESDRLDHNIARSADTTHGKRCSDCERFKVRSAFYVNGKSPDGLEKRCKVCKRARDERRRK